MAAMKIGAHPLVVAVAMGFLGPNALAEESEERHTSDRSMLASTDGPVLSTPDEVPEPPSAEEFARVEDLWHTVRTTL